MKILMLKGLPASGKSTLAKKIVGGDVHSMKGNWTRVNKDELRAMMHNSKHTKGNEAMVIKVRDEIIMKALNAGHNVIVDDTNFNPIHEQRMYEIAKCYKKCEVEVQFIDTPLEDCIARDLKRPNSVGERVIRTMYNEYLKPAKVEAKAPEHIEGVPDALVIDIDGTLAHMNGRSPYDPTRYNEDTHDKELKDLIKRYMVDHKIVLCSGRDDTYKDVTSDWLDQNEIWFDKLLMRKGGDKRNDAIVKQEIYENEIKGKYNVTFVLDDRNRVVNMWRENGLKCLQVADGDF